jgi:CO dehydrogenase maturation factor
VSHIIAVGGKGGVGKTLVVALLTNMLRHDRYLLAIDADPALGLTYALNAKPNKTIWDIRESLKEGPGRKKLFGDDKDAPLREVIRDQALLKMDNFDFLAMGRSEGPGCFCGINELLRYAIDSVAREYDIVLVDCEAGLEQVNRRVLRNMDTLVLISDPTVRGLQTIRHLDQIAKEHAAGPASLKTGLVFNRVDNESSMEGLKQDLSINIWGYLPNDPTIKEFDLEGKSLLKLPESSPAYRSLRAVLPRLMDLKKGE